MGKIAKPRLWTYVWFPCLAVSLGTRATLAGDVAFRRHVVNAHTDYSAAAVLDVNHDGKLDIFCGGDWYEAPDWKRHFARDVPRLR